MNCKSSMIFTLILPEANHNFTFDDIPISLVRCYLDQVKTIGELHDELEIYIPYIDTFKMLTGDLNMMEKVLNFIFEPTQPLTFELFQILKPFIQIGDPLDITINESLFNYLGLSKLSTEIVVVPLDFIKVMEHPMIGRKAISDNFRYPIEVYRELVDMYDEIVLHACLPFADFDKEMHLYIEKYHEVIIMKTIDRILKCKTTPRQMFLEQGKAYLFIGFKPHKTCHHVYLQLDGQTNDICVVKHYGGIFKYKPGDMITEIFDKTTMKQLNKLMSIKWE